MTAQTIDGMSANSDAMNAAITSAGQNPASATLDGQTTTERSADDLIKLRNDQATRDNNANSWMGLRARKIVPPGCG